MLSMMFIYISSIFNRLFLSILHRHYKSYTISTGRYCRNCRLTNLHFLIFHLICFDRRSVTSRSNDLATRSSLSISKGWAISTRTHRSTRLRVMSMATAIWAPEAWLCSFTRTSATRSVNRFTLPSSTWLLRRRKTESVCRCQPA